MKTKSRILNAILVLALLAAGPGVRLHAQAPAEPPAPGSPTAVAPNMEHMDAPDTRSENDEYRHSATVAAIARMLHVKTETAAEIFEDLNSGALILVLVVVVGKVLPGIFRKRSQAVQQELTRARAATEDANRRLAEVEARLSRLGSEIEAIRAQAEKDSVEDERRIHATLEAERERIIASAEQEIASLQAAAQRELKKFAADLAIDSAMRRMQVSTDTDRALVRDFSMGLSGGTGGKA